MSNRNIRDVERRNFIKEKTIENLKFVLDDPQSLFAKSEGEILDDR